MNHAVFPSKNSSKHPLPTAQPLGPRARVAHAVLAAAACALFTSCYMTSESNDGLRSAISECLDGVSRKDSIVSLSGAVEELFPASSGKEGGAEELKAAEAKQGGSRHRCAVRVVGRRGVRRP